MINLQMWEKGYPNSSGFHSYQKMRLRIALLKTSCSMHQTMTIAANFPIMYWSATLLFSRHVCRHLFKTVIVLEQISFHAHFNAQFYARHLNIFNFLDMLKQIQTFTYITIRSLDTPSLQRRMEVEKMNYSLEKYQDYLSGTTSRCIKIRKSTKMSKIFFLSMCDVKLFLTFVSLGLVLP
jgi:hypothetical protein